MVYSSENTPYVTLEKYTTGAKCALTDLLAITTYVADGKCHKTGASVSFIAVRKPDGRSAIKTFTTTSDCSGASTTLTITAAQYSGNSCAADANGIADTKVYGNGATALPLSSVATFADAAKSCKLVATSMLTQMVSTPTMSFCTPETTCKWGQTAEPYSSNQCGTSVDLGSTVATVIGASTPYVIVEKYAAGAKCALTDLDKITTYVADGKCHKTGATASFIATRALDGSAAVTTYTDSGMCASANGVMLSVTAAQVGGNSCAGDANGILDMRVYGSGATATVFSSILSYDTIAGNCKSPAVPTQVVTTLASSSACEPTSGCSGNIAPFTGFACTSVLTYKTDMANMFGTSSHIILERYAAGKSCNSEGLLSITTFLADSTCHKTSTSSSYKAIRKEDGATTINIFTTASCDTVGTTLAMTAAQVMGNSCANDANGLLDTKLYSSGAAPQYLSTTMTYDTKLNNCKLPAVPTRLFSAVVDKKSCASSTSCTGGSSPYNGTICCSTSSYQKDVAAVFGSSPYVIVEKYGNGKSCNAAALASIGTYVADTKCHRSSSTASFRAIRKEDGSATIMTYAGSGSCGLGPATLAVTSEQATINSCARGSIGVVDTKLYGSGATPLFLTVSAVYTSNANGCKLPSTPMMWVATPLSVDMCMPSVGCHYRGPLPTSTVCSSTRTYHEDVVVAFDWNSFVTVQKFIPGKGCSESALSSVTTYVADGSCHSSSSSASFTATQRYDGLVTIEIYTDSMYCGTEGWKLAATTTQATGNECIVTGYGDIRVSSIQK